jgi:hypothetical protein
VKQIVVYIDTLEFHLNTGEIVTTPWKNTAKRDAWAYRRNIAKAAANLEQRQYQER